MESRAETAVKSEIMLSTIKHGLEFADRNEIRMFATMKSFIITTAYVCDFDVHLV